MSKPNRPVAEELFRNSYRTEQKTVETALCRNGRGMFVKLVEKTHLRNNTIMIPVENLHHLIAMLGQVIEIAKNPPASGQFHVVPAPGETAPSADEAAREATAV